MNKTKYTIRRSLLLSLLFILALVGILFTREQNASSSLVTLTEFSDFQCPYCKRAASVVEQIRQTYGDRIKVVFKQMPLPMHQHAFKAAQASACAQEQGKFWEYHDRVFAASDLSPDALNRIAAEVGLNRDEFSQCLSSDASRAAVEKDMTEAARLGVSGTPTFFINGRALRGAAAFAALKQEIDAEMNHPQTQSLGIESATSNAPSEAQPLRPNTTSPAQVSTGSGSDRVTGRNADGGPGLGIPPAPTKAPQQAPAETGSGATLAIDDVTLAEDSCQNKNFVFTITLSKLAGRMVTVHYATSDGRPDQTGTAAVANQDYVPVSGTLTFTHSTRPNGPNGSYLLTIIVPLGNYVASTGTNDQRAFTLTLSDATNATISKARGVGTLLDAATSCMPAQNAGCFINFCGAQTTSCRNVNRSATAKRILDRGSAYCELAGLGTAGAPDPNWAACYFAGLWLDSDGDGLSDAAEIQGYIDVNANGVYDPGIDVPLPGADPHRVDVYVHYDYVAASDHDHNPPPQAIQYIVDAFAAHGANLHIDPQHSAIDESTARVVTQDSLTGGPPDYLPIPACSGDASTGGAVSMHQLRRTYMGNLGLAYHYVVFAHFSSCPDVVHCIACRADPECGSGTPPQFGAVGSAEIYGDDAIVSLGPYIDAGVAIPLETWAGVTMHELGHNFALLHGGQDCTNQKPNYISVMNYNFYATGIPVGAAPGDSVPKSCATDADCPAPAHCSGPNGLIPNTCVRIDYSGEQLPNLNECAVNLGESNCRALGQTRGLNESEGLGGSPTSTDVSFYTLDGFTPIYVPTNGTPIDWNQDGIIETHVTQDLNGDGAQSLLTGSNDWATSNGLFTHFNFDFQCSLGFQDDAPALASNRVVSLLRFPATGGSPRMAPLPSFPRLFQFYWLRPRALGGHNWLTNETVNKRR